MAVFSTLQNRHLYVVSAYKAAVANTDDAGTIGSVKVSEGAPAGKELHFLYKGADNVLKSDRIQLKNLDYVKAIDASEMVTPLKVKEVTLDSTINSGAPISGQDYLLRIAFRQFYGMSDEDQYFKDAAVHATASMSASDFYKAMVKALNLAFSREVGATPDANPYLEFSVDNTTTATKLIIKEKEQGWTLGLGAKEPVYFEVIPTTVYDGHDDLVWGVVTDATPAKYTKKGGEGTDKDDLVPNPAIVVGTNAIGNGTKIADLEWFCMGERGDQYRMMGYPNYIPTKYLVDPTQQYHVLEIHHAFTDTGVNSYRSEKDITIVAPATSAGKAALNSLIGAINEAAGTEYATLA